MWLPSRQPFRMVVRMETNGPTTPDQAREHLAAARAAEGSTRFPGIPGWLVGADAVLLPMLVLSQLVSSPQAPTSLGLVIIVLNVIVLARSGVMQGGQSATFYGTVATAAALAVLFGGASLAYAQTGESWVVIAAAALSFLVVVGAGLAYRRSIPRAWQ